MHHMLDNFIATAARKREAESDDAIRRPIRRDPGYNQPRAAIAYTSATKLLV